MQCVSSLVKSLVLSFTALLLFIGISSNAYSERPYALKLLTQSEESIQLTVEKESFISGERSRFFLFSLSQNKERRITRIDPKKRSITLTLPAINRTTTFSVRSVGNSRQENDRLLSNLLKVQKLSTPTPTPTPIRTYTPLDPNAYFDAINLPVEVFSTTTQGATETLEFELNQDAQYIDKIRLHLYSMTPDNQASMTINGVSFSLVNSLILEKPYSQYDRFIAFKNTKGIILLPQGLLHTGKNVVTFSGFPNKTVMGYRVLKLEFIDDRNVTIPILNPVREYPREWFETISPLSSQPQIDRGKALWNTKQMVANPLENDRLLDPRVHCASCHFVDGSDLNIFRFTDRAIKARAQFHGFTQDEAADLVAFIRSTSELGEGRPENGLFQPGEGIREKSSPLFGAGIDAILPDENAVRDELFSGGIIQTPIEKLELNAKTFKVPFPTLTWNEVLPRFTAIEGLTEGIFENSDFESRMQECRNYFDSHSNDREWLHYGASYPIYFAICFYQLSSIDGNKFNEHIDAAKRPPGMSAEAFKDEMQYNFGLLGFVRQIEIHLKYNIGFTTAQGNEKMRALGLTPRPERDYVQFDGNLKASPQLRAIVNLGGFRTNLAPDSRFTDKMTYLLNVQWDVMDTIARNSGYYTINGLEAGYKMVNLSTAVRVGLPPYPYTKLLIYLHLLNQFDNGVGLDSGTKNTYERFEGLSIEHGILIAGHIIDYGLRHAYIPQEKRPALFEFVAPAERVQVFEKAMRVFMKKMRKYPKEQFRNSLAYDAGFAVDYPYHGNEFHRSIHLILQSFVKAGYRGPFLDEVVSFAKEWYPDVTDQRKFDAMLQKVLSENAN